MIEFLSQHWLGIVEIAFSLACVLIYLLKKNKVISKDTEFAKLLEALPGLISKAEKVFSGGSQKKGLVYGVALDLIADWKDISIDEAKERYGDRISSAIEAILETPQKKEVILYDDKEK